MKREYFSVSVDGKSVGFVCEDKKGRGFRFTRHGELSGEHLEGRTFPSARQAIAQMLIDEAGECFANIADHERLIRDEQEAIRVERSRRASISNALERIRRGGPLNGEINPEVTYTIEFKEYAA